MKDYELVSNCCLSSMVLPATEDEIEAAGSLWRAYACHICKKCGRPCMPITLPIVPKEILADHDSFSGLDDTKLSGLNSCFEQNILERANDIVNKRSEEKEREYGPFGESMERMRDVFNGMTGLNLKTEHMFDALIALKISRMGYSHKEDSYLDAVAYIAAKNNYVLANKI